MDAGVPLEKQYVYIPREYRSRPSPSTLPKGRNRFLTKENMLSGLLGVALAGGVLVARNANFSTSQISSPTPITEIAPSNTSEPEPEILNEPTHKAENFGDVNQRTKDVLKEEKWIRNITDDPRLKIPKENRDFWAKRMMALIAIESNSEIHASSGIAFGFAQLKKETQDEIAKEYKIPKYDRFNSWESTLMGLAHQLKLADRYGNDLSLWAHHLGSGNMDQIILAYLKPLLPDGDSLKEKGISNNLQLRRYIEHYGITTETLLKYPKIDEILESIDAHDKTDQYYLRYKAVTDIIDSTRREASLTQETKA